jgi:hypothetical protein
LLSARLDRPFRRERVYAAEERKRVLKYEGVGDRVAVSWLLALADRGRCCFGRRLDRC